MLRYECLLYIDAFRLAREVVVCLRAFCIVDLGSEDIDMCGCSSARYQSPPLLIKTESRSRALGYTVSLSPDEPTNCDDGSIRRRFPVRGFTLIPISRACLDVTCKSLGRSPLALARNISITSDRLLVTP